MADVTMQEWEEMRAAVLARVKRAAKDADSPILRAVLTELEEPNDFVGGVVDRLVA